MESWQGYDRLYVVSDRLVGAPEATASVRMHRFHVLTFEDHREAFLRKLDAALQGVTDQGSIDELCTSLNESLMNVSEHVHKFDRSKRALIHIYKMDKVIGYTIQHEEARIDTSKIRLSALNPDGSLHKGFRGRGHIMMKAYSDNCAYPITVRGGAEYTAELYGAKKIAA